MPKKASQKSSKKPSATSYEPRAKLSWLPNNTFELEFIIPWIKVKDNYQKSLKEIASQTTIKGFRKGKAPLSLIEKNIDKARLYKKVLENLLPETYFETLKQHQLHPICDPKIIPLGTQEGKDWIFKATACEIPNIVLGNYEEEIKALHAKEKIWLPGQEKSKKETQEKDTQKSLKEIFDILLKTCQVDLAEILIEQEQKRMLSRLLAEIKKLGLTLEEYLTSNQKTVEQLKEEHKKTAQQTLKLEFILQEITNKKNFSVEQTEIDNLIAAVPDEKSRENLKNQLQQVYIASFLRKRKAIDFLLKL